MLRGKLAVPEVPVHSVRRARLDEAFSTALRDHEIVFVIGGPGTGKTVAVRQLVETVEHPVAWLTLDRRDRAPGRLITYLAAALDGVAEGATELVSEVLAAGLSHLEAAGLVAERASDYEHLLVIDDVESLEGSDESLAVLGLFLEYLAPPAQVILISRRGPSISLARSEMAGRVAAFGEQDLALSLEEVAALQRRLGSKCDPAQVAERTGGWMAAVIFDSSDRWMRGPRDPLFTYLGEELLAGLGEAEQQFLLATAPYDAVTPEVATHVAGDDGLALFEVLLSLHVPCIRLPGGAIRYHQRFRDFLEDQIEARGTAGAIHRLHAAYLAEHGLSEDAAEAYLQCGDTERGLVHANRAAERVARRGDWDTILRWSEQAGSLLTAHPALLTARLTALTQLGFIRKSRSMVDQLVEGGLVQSIGEEHPALFGAIANVLENSGSHALIPDLLSGNEHPVAKSLIACARLMTSESPNDVVWRTRAGVGVFPRTMLAAYTGRFDLLHQLRMEATGIERYLLDANVSTFLAEWTGEGFHDADVPDWYDRTLWGIWGRGMRGSLRAREGNLEEGVEETAEALREADDRGAHGPANFIRIYHARNLILSEECSEALEALEATVDELARESALCHLEYADTYRGLAQLSLGLDCDARTTLEDVISRIRRSGRPLYHIPAAAFLSEARWRDGDEEGADEALDEALVAARRVATLHPLLTALRDVPSVLSRRLDALSSYDALWHGLARAMTAGRTRLHGWESPLRWAHHLKVETLTTPSLVLNDARIEGVPRKSVELAALLASRRDGLSRDRIIELLFSGEEPSAARGYLRTVLYRLDKELPDDSRLERGSLIRFPRSMHVTTSDRELEIAAANATTGLGHRRYERMVRVADAMDNGRYLEGADGEWVEDRRRELDALKLDVYRDAAAAALTVSDFPAALAWADRAVACGGPPDETASIRTTALRLLGRAG